MEIMSSFLEKRRWSQRALAARVGIGPKRLREHLRALQSDHAWPLSQTGSAQHPVWEMPTGWAPLGLFIPNRLLPDLLHILLRAPRGKARERLLERVRECVPSPHPDTVVTGHADPAEEDHLPLVLQAAEKKVPIWMRYWTAGRNAEETRRASIQRVLAEDAHARFLAVCHKTNELRLFRVDRIRAVRLEERVAFLTADPQHVERRISETFGGMHEGGPARELSFFVRDPEARWEQGSLPSGMKAERSVRGMRVAVKTSAPRQVARYVVGLGEAAEPESPELTQMVRQLALGALETCEHAAIRANSTSTPEIAPRAN
jgi:predicted DNA-binding transcriptional regulator YafY